MATSTSELPIPTPATSIGDLVTNMSDLTTTAPTRHDIFNKITLRNKVIVLVYDVYNSHVSQYSHARLAKAATSPCHFGHPHFNPSEVEYLSSMEVKHGVTLGDMIKSAIHAGN